MYVCVAIPFILDVRLVDAPDGVTQEEGNTGFLQLPSAVLALTFITRRIQPSLSLVDREVEFCDPRINRSPLVGRDFYFINYIVDVWKVSIIHENVSNHATYIMQHQLVL